MAINLEVNNLRISFRTNNGKVQAVRDISFKLEQGKTLAIVGESGSGKSVTSKAILGILAGNSIIEGGEIIFDGRDLLKIDEEEMYRIRGDKIAMIFQDPLSSLNPIVKIGKQITEAMLLKNKASRRESRKDFNSLLALLQAQMIADCGASSEARIKELTSTFNSFCVEANKLENAYNHAANTVADLLTDVEDVQFKASKNQKLDGKALLREYANKLKTIKEPFFTAKFTERMAAVSAELLAARKYTAEKNALGLPESVLNAITQLENLLRDMQEQPRPNFFRIGFYAMKHPGEDLTGRDMDKLNEEALAYLNENFMNEFIALQERGVAYSHRQSVDKKKLVLEALKEGKAYFSGELKSAGAMKYAKSLADLVDASIDRLEIVKDGVAYTFRTSLNSAISRYFAAVAFNPKEEARFERQTKKHDALVAKGKNVEWKVVPKSLHDLDALKNQIVSVLERLEKKYQDDVVATVDYHQRCIEIIDYLKEKASKVVYKVTKAMAKERAIKLMEEVGISEARMRFNQYPFEFSGGMRQRIVIAIALSADPEVLICDEPTTALDVTIQAQILELINKLKNERNLSVIFITHDLGVVANMADDIAVMYAGKIIEYGTADDVFYDPRHPYTWALLSAMPDLDTKEKLDAIPGTPPDMRYPPAGDAFALRNKYAMQIDFEQQPPMFEISETHRAATWLLHPDAPKVEIPKAITDRIARMKKAGGAENG
ncbi:MAG: ABC transporter ATP-binding protein [Oscillospiraceae bacterium]|nr:ABC transporter ATP-binding protein [Oscillospiraceae bacterium]